MSPTATVASIPPCVHPYPPCGCAPSFPPNLPGDVWLSSLLARSIRCNVFAPDRQQQGSRPFRFMGCSFHVPPAIPVAGRLLLWKRCDLTQSQCFLTDSFRADCAWEAMRERKGAAYRVEVVSQQRQDHSRCVVLHVAWPPT